MKQLILLRHAEADPAPPGHSDIARPLTEPGRLEAATAAGVIDAAKLSIDGVLVSPARRTRETASILVARLNLSAPVEYIPELYLASSDAMLMILQRYHPGARTLLVIAHNPGISELAQQLVTGAQEAILRTAGVCLLALPQDSWDAIDMGTAQSYRLLR